MDNARLTLKERRLYHCHFFGCGGLILILAGFRAFLTPFPLACNMTILIQNKFVYFAYQEFMEPLYPYLINHHRLGILFYYSLLRPSAYKTPSSSSLPDISSENQVVFLLHLGRRPSFRWSGGLVVLAGPSLFPKAQLITRPLQNCRRLT